MTITDATGQALIAAWRAKYPGAGWPTLSDAKEMLCAALANGKALLSNELLPCPVCGSAFLISQEPHDNHLVAGKFYIFHEYGPIGSAARACPIDVPKHFDTREEAIAAWNRRTPDPELLAARRAQQWQPIETARKTVDETVLLRIEHINYGIAAPDDKHRWEELVTAYWTDFNGGGWVWHGLAGTPTHWRPLPRGFSAIHPAPSPSLGEARLAEGEAVAWR